MPQAGSIREIILFGASPNKSRTPEKRSSVFLGGVFASLGSPDIGPSPGDP